MTYKIVNCDDSVVIGTCEDVETSISMSGYEIIVRGWVPGENENEDEDPRSRLDKIIDVANAVRHRLLEDGWEYEAACDIAGEIVKKKIREGNWIYQEEVRAT